MLSFGCVLKLPGTGKRGLRILSSPSAPITYRVPQSNIFRKDVQGFAYRDEQTVTILSLSYLFSTAPLLIYFGNPYAK
jgi:hypothetical protein